MMRNNLLIHSRKVAMIKYRDNYSLKQGNKLIIYYSLGRYIIKKNIPRVERENIQLAFASHTPSLTLEHDNLKFERHLDNLVLPVGFRVFLGSYILFLLFSYLLFYTLLFSKVTGSCITTS